MSTFYYVTIGMATLYVAYWYIRQPAQLREEVACENRGEKYEPKPDEPDDFGDGEEYEPEVELSPEEEVVEYLNWPLMISCGGLVFGAAGIFLPTRPIGGFLLALLLGSVMVFLLFAIRRRIQKKRLLEDLPHIKVPEVLRVRTHEVESDVTYDAEIIEEYEGKEKRTD
jgi:hypothetical protein